MKRFLLPLLLVALPLAFLHAEEPSPALPDANANGMSDIWERHFNSGKLFPPFFLPTGNADGDGFTNLNECIAGTNPLDAQDYPKKSIRFIPEESGPSLVEIEFNTVPGKHYRIFHSENLSDWSEVAWPVHGYGYPESILLPSEDSNGNQAPKGFWKLAISNLDQDRDGINDADEWLAGTSIFSPVTFGPPDIWIIEHFGTAHNYDNMGDADNDGLSNFEEYFHGTSPTIADSDHDGTNDGAEVSQGGDPANPADEGNPPEDLLEEITFLIGGDYASWRMKIKGLGPRDSRTLNFVSPEPGVTGTHAFKLRKNNRYEITLHRTGGHEDWYCWEAAISGWPGSPSFEVNSGQYTLNDRNDRNHFFVVGKHWLVDNRQGLFTSHLHSYEENVAGELKARLVPIAIEDNLMATGVDNISISAKQMANNGHQDKLWIMAPIAGTALPDYSNLMKFHIPLSPPADLVIDIDQAEPDPDTITLDTGKPEVLWRGTGANETSDKIPMFKIGEHQDEVELPIAVKVMKHRVVKVAVYPVRKSGWFVRDVHLPDKAQLIQYLNEIYGYQINAWFEIDYINENNQPQFNYDLNGDNKLIQGAAEETELVTTRAFKEPVDDYDIEIILIDDMDYDLPGGIPLGGQAHRVPRTCVISVARHGEPVRADSDIIDTIAHEIGHVIIGAGHPNEYTGFAQLFDVDASNRLMSSLHPVGNGVPRAPGAKLLVKKEWDLAEEWLEANIKDK